MGRGDNTDQQMLPDARLLNPELQQLQKGLPTDDAEHLLRLAHKPQALTGAGQLYLPLDNDEAWLAITLSANELSYGQMLANPGWTTADVLHFQYDPNQQMLVALYASMDTDSYSTPTLQCASKVFASNPDESGAEVEQLARRMAINSAAFSLEQIDQRWLRRALSPHTLFKEGQRVNTVEGPGQYQGMKDEWMIIQPEVGFEFYLLPDQVWE